MRPASERERFFAALTLSCLLHAGLLFMLNLALSTALSRPGAPGREADPLPVLHASLALETAAAAAEPAALPAAAGADASAESAVKEEPLPVAGRNAGAGLLPATAPTYYTPDQLTKRPQPTAEAQLHTPETKMLSASGSISLKLWISEFGDVIAVDIDKTDLPQAFSDAAIAGFKKLRFAPGEVDGRPVGAVLPIEVTYDVGAKPPP